MPRTNLCIALAALVAIAGATVVSADFDDHFSGATMRLDFFHTGTAAMEHIALDSIRVEGFWPGSRTQLIDDSNGGKYFFEIVDMGSQRILYSRGFASIYGEWETTGEARRGTVRTFAEALRFPEPKMPVQVRLRKRGEKQAFREIWSTVVDPASRFVSRAPVGKYSTRAVRNAGDSALKVDLLILGDGYTADEMAKYHKDVDRAAGALFGLEPFKKHEQDFNVWAVETPADESGISRPRSGLFRDSPLGASYNALDSERYVLSLDDRAWRDAAAAVPYDFVLMLVNSEKYGGGGIYNLYSTAATDSGFMSYLVVHEFGHHFAGLGDEYYTSDVAYEDFNGQLEEPWEANITALHDPEALKWRDLVEEGTPLPTPWNKVEFEETSRAIQQQRRKLRADGAPEAELERLFTDERRTMSELLADNEWAGKVGAFEGASYQPSGLYRPQADCIMFTRDEVGFCFVCSRAIERVIAMYTR